MERERIYKGLLEIMTTNEEGVASHPFFVHPLLSLRIS